MAIAEIYNNSATIGTTEYDLPTNSTSAVSSQSSQGIYQVFLDLNTLTATEEYRLRIYEKVRSSSTQRVIEEIIISGSQSPQPVLVTPALLLKNGWSYTLKLNQGTPRTIEWSIRQVA